MFFPRRSGLQTGLFLSACLATLPVFGAQGTSHSGLISGTVTDPSGAVISNAKISLLNPISGYNRETTSDAQGRYQFQNVPFNNYHVVVSANGFGSITTDALVDNAVTVVVKNVLQIGAASQNITVSGEDLVNHGTDMHSTVDRALIAKLPLESQSSALSSMVTLAAPGVAADSNGLLHGLGDHNSTSFSIDGQPVTDQQSKVFSNQLPSSSVQSITVIDGAPPAEYGDKTSLVVQVTTRSGLGVHKPTGDIYGSYGSFGSTEGGFDVSNGNDNTGNFLEFDGQNSGRFLDTPEFAVLHDKGNEENAFDRVDHQITQNDSVHLNLNYSRSWFQTPNTFDNLEIGNVDPITGQATGATDQRSKIETFNIAPTYTRTFGANAVLNVAPFVRKDAFSYIPSGDPFADLGPADLQRETVAQNRSLLNAGIHADLTLVHGINTVKMGALYQHTWLREHDTLGIVDSTLNPVCLDANGDSVNGFTDPSQCAVNGFVANDAFDPNLLPYDLTRGGSDYHFFGHADVKELGLYMQDQIKAGNWLLNLGIRGDLYNGLAVARQAEPRVGIAYNVKKTNTVLRVSYARTLETPFNENLVLSSVGCGDPVLNPLLACAPGVTNTVEEPGFRNEFHAGLTQAISRHFVLSGEYIWKYTHNAFDFSVLGNTPISFPIDWHNSKIPGFAIRGDMPEWHDVSAYVVMSSVAARYFNPQLAGAGATPGVQGSNLPFRIDHDEHFNQTTHVQYQVPNEKFKPWFGFNWHYDSGLVAGAVPCFNDIPGANSGCAGTSIDGPGGQQLIDLSGLTADQQFQAGLVCNGQVAGPFTPLPNQCPANELTSKLVKIPAPNAEDDDKNPPRIAPRHVFDLVVGDDDLFHGDRYKWSLQLSGTNISNNYALYNFLSTFSGTHYLTPRALSAQVGFHF